MEQINGLIFFFLTIFIGYFAAKSRLLPVEAADVLPAVLINICYPAMILDTFTHIDTDALLHTGLPVALATLGVTVVLFFASLWMFRRQPARRKPLLCIMTGIGNTSYVAIPLLSVFLGAEGMFIAIINSAVQDILIWTLYHPLFLGAGTKDKKELLRKIFTSPCLIAAVAGVVLAACRVTLPSFPPERYHSACGAAVFGRIDLPPRSAFLAQGPAGHGVCAGQSAGFAAGDLCRPAILPARLHHAAAGCPLCQPRAADGRGLEQDV